LTLGLGFLRPTARKQPELFGCGSGVSAVSGSLHLCTGEPSPSPQPLLHHGVTVPRLKSQGSFPLVDLNLPNVHNPLPCPPPAAAVGASPMPGASIIPLHMATSGAGCC
jgi:hypothetical protein